MTEKTTVITNNKKISDTIKKKLSAAITYFTNQLPRMNYHKYTAQNLPIGSGVIEEACKTLIKQSLCRSGMIWNDKKAAIVLSLLSVVKNTNRWEQFWNKINYNGIHDH